MAIWLRKRIEDIFMVKKESRERGVLGDEAPLFLRPSALILRRASVLFSAMAERLPFLHPASCISNEKTRLRSVYRLLSEITSANERVPDAAGKNRRLAKVKHHTHE